MENYSPESSYANICPFNMLYNGLQMPTSPIKMVLGISQPHITVLRCKELFVMPGTPPSAAGLMAPSGLIKGCSAVCVECSDSSVMHLGSISLYSAKWSIPKQFLMCDFEVVLTFFNFS